MKIFPSKTQWNNWTLPSKASYVGAWLAIIGIIIAIIIKIFPFETKKEELYLNNATIKPILINDKEDLSIFKISFELKNLGNKEVTITNNRVYIVDLENNKYEKVGGEEINPQTLYPEGPPVSPFVVGYTKEMFKTHRYFILLVEYMDRNNIKGIKYFFRKIQKLKSKEATYSKDLFVVNISEENKLKDLLKYLLKNEIEKNEILKKELNI